MSYRHLTNLSSPVDDVDGNFLNVLSDYKIGPPVATKGRDAITLMQAGVFGVYTTEERIMSKEVQSLTGFSIKSLGTETLDG